MTNSPQSPQSRSHGHTVFPGDFASPEKFVVTEVARVFKGFRDFVMRGDVITVAVGLVVALAFSNLVKAFTDSVINPLVAAAQPHTTLGLGWQLGDPGNKSTFLDIGAFISAIIYFLVFMATVYLAIVVPYRHIQKRRGVTVFGDEPATKACSECLSDIPDEAHKCKYCASDQPAAA
jgi:large conductance mechanosensitive channel